MLVSIEEKHTINTIRMQLYLWISPKSTRDPRVPVRGLVAVMDYLIGQSASVEGEISTLVRGDDGTLEVGIVFNIDINFAMTHDGGLFTNP